LLIHFNIYIYFGTEEEDDEQDEAEAPGPGGGGGAEEDPQAAAEGAHAAALDGNADAGTTTVAALDVSAEGGFAVAENEAALGLGAASGHASLADELAAAADETLETEASDEDEDEDEADTTLDTSFAETEADTSVEIEEASQTEDAFARGSATNRRGSLLTAAAASVQPVEFADLFALPAAVGNPSRRGSAAQSCAPPLWSATAASHGPRTPFAQKGSGTPRALLRPNLPPTPLVSAYGPYDDWGFATHGSGQSGVLQRRTTLETWQLDLDDMDGRATMMRRHLATHTLPGNTASFNAADSGSSSSLRAPGSHRMRVPGEGSATAPSSPATVDPAGSNGTWPLASPGAANAADTPNACAHLRSQQREDAATAGDWPTRSGSSGRGLQYDAGGGSSNSSTGTGIKRNLDARCRSEDSSADEDSDDGAGPSSRARPECE
jgi:hypothetical protein